MECVAKRGRGRTTQRSAGRAKDGNSGPTSQLRTSRLTASFSAPSPPNPCRAPAPILPASPKVSAWHEPQLARWDRGALTQGAEHPCTPLMPGSTHLQKGPQCCTVTFQPGSSYIAPSPWEGRGCRASFHHRLPSALKGVLQPPVIYATLGPRDPGFPARLLQSISKPWLLGCVQPCSEGLFRLPLISKRSMREAEESEEGKAGGEDAKNQTLSLVGTVNRTRGVKGSINLQQLSALDILTVSASKIHDIFLGGR